jgi:hypothetical protein
MLSANDYRHLVVRIGESSRRKRPRTPTSWRESLGTLMLGALSTSLGLAVLAGLVTRKPSFDLFLTAYIGQWLGLAGLYLARRIGRGIAPLPLLGTALCLVILIPVYLILLLFLMAIVLPVALPICGISTLMRTLRATTQVSWHRRETEALPCTALREGRIEEL